MAPPVPTGLGTWPETPCTPQPPLAWLGWNNGVTFSAELAAPETGTVRAQFRITAFGTDETVAEHTTFQGYGGPVSVQFPARTFADATNYQWSVRTVQGDAVSAWTTPCGLRTDFTPPTAPGVSSSVYPADGTGAVVRTPGEFVFTPGAATDVVAYEYVLNGTFSVGGGNPLVPAEGPDGVGKVVLRPYQWGTNVLEVQTVDAAGNRSGTTRYTFYAQSPPGPDQARDYDGDGLVDLLTVEADGIPSVRFGLPGGEFAPPTPLRTRTQLPEDPANLSLVPALRAMGNAYQDLLVVYGGYAAVHLGDGLGGSQDSLSLNLPYEVGDILPTADLVTVGESAAESGQPTMLLHNGDQLWYLGALNRFYFGADPVLIGSAGWSHRTVAAAGDVTGDGVPDLWIRDTGTGSLHLAPGAADNPAAYGNPKKWIKVAGKGWKPSSRPLLVSAGDGNGDGRPDLWATDANGTLLLYPTNDKGKLGAPVAVGTGWLGVTSVA